MQIDTQEYLDLVEQTNKLVFFDIESTGFKGDYNSILCCSFKPYGKKPFTLKVKQVGNDNGLVREIRDVLTEYSCWATYYGKGFDVPMINTRILKWGAGNPLPAKHHLDLYFTLKPKINTSSKSMASVARFLKLGDQKMDVTPEVWSEIGFNMNKHMPTMVQRCESDCTVLEAAYMKTRHLIKEIKKG